MEKNKLTKFSDIFYYYKWYAFGVIALIVVVIMIISGIVNKVEDDVTINMLLSYDAAPTAGEEISADIENGVILDVDGDGITQSYINVVTVPYEFKDEADINSGMQASLVFAIDEAILCFIDKDLLDLYSDKDFFEDISEKASALGYGEEAVYKNPQGVPVGISLNGNKYLEEKGVTTKDLYVCFKHSAKKDTERYKAIRQSAENVLDYIIEKGK